MPATRSPFDNRTRTRRSVRHCQTSARRDDAPGPDVLCDWYARPWWCRAGGTGGPQRRLRNRHDRLRARGLGRPQREEPRADCRSASARPAGSRSPVSSLPGIAPPLPAAFSGRPPRREMPVAGIRVSTSVTYASIVLCPVALATETRWWPSLTKCRSRRGRRRSAGSPRRAAARDRAPPTAAAPGRRWAGTCGRSRAGSRRSRPRCRAEWSAGQGSARRASPGRRPPRRTTGCGRRRRRRSQPAIRASTCRRRARLKSSSTSTHDKPVSKCMAAPRPCLPGHRGHLEFRGPRRHRLHVVLPGRLVRLLWLLRVSSSLK